MNKQTEKALAEALRAVGFRATPGRIELLSVLASAKRPLSVPHIAKKLSKQIDPATVYRALEDLARKGVVSQVDFRHGHAHFEFVSEGKHHHHLVCTSCGALEDIKCPVPETKREITRVSKRFSNISDHSLEFFSLCNVCTEKVRS